MNRRIYILIITLVTVLICVSAFAYHTGRAISGCAACLSEDIEWNGSTLREWAKEGSELSGNYVEEDYIANGYTDIDLKGAVADVTIKEGDDYSFHFYGDEVLKPDVSVKNNTLVATQKKVRTNFTNNHRYAEITITVPKGTLKHIELDSAVGNATIKKLSCDSIDAVMAVGTIYVEDVTCSGKVKIEANVGEIRLTGSTFGDMNLNSDVGEVYISGCDFEDAEIDSDIGNVTIKGIDPDKYDFDVDCSLGDFEYNGKDYGKRGRINNKEARYTLNVNADIGSVDIDTK